MNWCNKFEIISCCTRFRTGNYWSNQTRITIEGLYAKVSEEKQKKIWDLSTKSLKNVCRVSLSSTSTAARILNMLELIETGSILRIILTPLFTMKCIWVCQYIAQVSLAYWYSVGMPILRSRVRFPVVALSFLFDSRPLYEAMIYWVYCDYSLLEAPWSKLLALLDLIIEYICIFQPSPAPTPRD